MGTLNWQVKVGAIGMEDMHIYVCMYVYYLFILNIILNNIIFILFNIFYLFVFRERGSEGETQGEKHQSVTSPMHPNRGPNPQSFALQNDAQPTEPHQSEI